MIKYKKELNPAQWEAVSAIHGPVLVIAGAGSGKTRTIVYRLAHLVDQGAEPESILLLTFTRKAAHEMLNRAEELLGQGMSRTMGGTFHSLAYAMLRRFSGASGISEGFTVMDRPDAESVIRQVRDEFGLGKGERSFPKKRTVIELISKSKNKETPLPDLLQKEACHLLPFADDIQKISVKYAEFKAAHGLLDYDDLLFDFERLLTGNEAARDFVRFKYRFVMVDEYQDTNLVQARLVKLLSGEEQNVMVVGDDAQSIYAFRGANVYNILNFPDMFPQAKLIRLEQNYRSTQPILDLANRVLEQAEDRFPKNLFTTRANGTRPRLFRTHSDKSQANAVLTRIRELSRTYPLSEIAVLFRAGYHSYPLEILLNKLGVKFQKYGGVKFSEAAHVKDALAYLRLLQNPADLPSWQRVL
ncbi:MAG: ATP-dependent helicase, partial [Thermodesulfobacteriota bacterium]|nr:ATP-dependent helicase [Thermodesulfobacteriota bacterium]